MSTQNYSRYQRARYDDDYYTAIGLPTPINTQMQNYKYYVYLENKENAQKLIDIWKYLNRTIQTIQADPQGKIHYANYLQVFQDFQTRIESVVRHDNIGENINSRFNIIGSIDQYKDDQLQGINGTIELYKGIPQQVQFKGKGLSNQEIDSLKRTTIAEQAISVLNDLHLQNFLCYETCQQMKNDPEMQQVFALIDQYHEKKMKQLEAEIAIQSCNKANGRCNAGIIDIAFLDIDRDLDKFSEFNCPLSASNKCKNRCEICCRCRKNQIYEASLDLSDIESEMMILKENPSNSKSALMLEQGLDQSSSKTGQTLETLSNSQSNNQSGVDSRAQSSQNSRSQTGFDSRTQSSQNSGSQTGFGKQFVTSDDTTNLIAQIDVVIKRGRLVAGSRNDILDNHFPSLVKLMKVNPYLYMSSPNQIKGIHKLLSSFDNEITKYQGNPELMAMFASDVMKEQLNQQGTPVQRKNNYKQGSLNERVKARVSDGSLYADRKFHHDNKSAYNAYQEPVYQQDYSGRGLQGRVPQQSMQTLFEIEGDEKMDTSTIEMLRSLTGNFDLIN